MGHHKPLSQTIIVFKSIIKARGALVMLDIFTLAAGIYALQNLTSNMLIQTLLAAALILLYASLLTQAFSFGENFGRTRTTSYFISRISQVELEVDEPPLGEHSDSLFNPFAQDTPSHLSLDLNRLRPWEFSRPDKRARDRLIWEMRNNGETWEGVANKTNIPVSTVRSNYERMLALVSRSGGPPKTRFTPGSLLPS